MKTFDNIKEALDYAATELAARKHRFIMNIGPASLAGNAGKQSPVYVVDENRVFGDGQFNLTLYLEFGDGKAEHARFQEILERALFVQLGTADAPRYAMKLGRDTFVAAEIIVSILQKVYGFAESTNLACVVRDEGLPGDFKSLEGHLLVATSQLVDPNFGRSVVLLIRHNEQGAFGLVINRRTETQLNQVWKQVSETPLESDLALFLGGPIQGPLMCLHGSEELAEIEVTAGVFFSAASEKIEQLVTDSQPPLKAVAGYAGWGAGQLEGEIERGSWHIIKATREHVFGEEDELWEAVTREIHRAQMISMLHIKHVPADPRAN